MRDNKPPLTAEATLNFAWGLTLNFSHEDVQKNMGQVFIERYKDVWKEQKNSANDIGFLNNVAHC